MTTVLVNAQVRLDSKFPWLKYAFASGYALLLSAIANFAPKVFPHAVYTYAGLWPWMVGLILLGLFAAALFGGYIAVWAGILAGKIGCMILGWVLTGGISNLGPLLLVVTIVIVAFTLPAGYVGEQLRNLVLRQKAAHAY